MDREMTRIIGEAPFCDGCGHRQISPGLLQKKVRQVAPPVGEGSKRAYNQTRVSDRLDIRSMFLSDSFSFCTCYLEIYV